ncbi:MAG: CDP-alcohol phosphatidyltransferase family protein [Acidobacteria bacterium]|nr:CDP-alcohol phosphatidyltransferase family protein [Acidobacteriota bacterium]
MGALDPVLRQLTLANQLTLLRLAAVPLLALALLEGSVAVALAIYVGAALTDLLDGIAARRVGKPTALGAFLDPAADKLMMVTVFVTLALPDNPRAFPAFELWHHVPPWLTLLVVARDVLIVLVAAGFYFAYGVSRFPPSRISKWNTALEMVTGGLFLLANVWSAVPAGLLHVAAIGTAAIIVASGVAYLLRTRRWLRQSP